MPRAHNALIGSTQVGKAWLCIARMYQTLASSSAISAASGGGNGGAAALIMAKSADALERARRSCHSMAQACGSSVQAEDSFEYLTARAAGKLGAAAPVETI